MFRYLWKFKIVSTGLVGALAAGFYLYPAYAWLALGVLVFLRVTKLHSYLVMVDLTDRAATKHVRVLATKRVHMLSPDEYGNVSDEIWEKNLNQFIKKTLLPELKRKKVDHLVTADTKRQLKRLRKRINRIIDGYQPVSQSRTDDEDLLTGQEYEVYCKRILEDAGWYVVLTPGSGDQGADIIAEKEDRRVVNSVQVLQRTGWQQGCSGGLCSGWVPGCSLCGGHDKLDLHEIGSPARSQEQRGVDAPRGSGWSGGCAGQAGAGYSLILVCGWISSV
jgi:restriction system protein